MALASFKDVPIQRNSPDLLIDDLGSLCESSPVHCPRSEHLGKTTASSRDTLPTYILLSVAWKSCSGIAGCDWLILLAVRHWST